ncbi:MAG: type II toxin-antitoxin system VapC family toxin [Pseudomonadota bacterium]|nr:type II toxin-antitoxin system VapC family toxin [Pseudomonadota bacterium]
MERLTACLARLRGQKVYFDTNVLVYFFDRNPLYFPVAAALIQAVDRGDCFGFTGDAVVAELMVHPYKSNSPAEIARGKAFFARKNFITVLGHDAQAFDTAARLRAASSLKLMDALHCATAIQAGCRFFVTHDRDFNALASDKSLQVIRIADLL